MSPPATGAKSLASDRCRCDPLAQVPTQRDGVSLQRARVGHPTNAVKIFQRKGRQERLAEHWLRFQRRFAQLLVERVEERAGNSCSFEPPIMGTATSGAFSVRNFRFRQVLSRISRHSPGPASHKRWDAWFGGRGRTGCHPKTARR